MQQEVLLAIAAGAVVLLVLAAVGAAAFLLKGDTSQRPAAPQEQQVPYTRHSKLVIPNTAVYWQASLRLKWTMIWHGYRLLLRGSEAPQGLQPAPDGGDSRLLGKRPKR